MVALAGAVLPELLDALGHVALHVAPLAGQGEHPLDQREVAVGRRGRGVPPDGGVDLLHVPGRDGGQQQPAELGNQDLLQADLIVVPRALVRLGVGQVLVPRKFLECGRAAGVVGLAGAVGGPPIELVDAEKLIDMLEDLKLGLIPVEAFRVTNGQTKLEPTETNSRKRGVGPTHPVPLRLNLDRQKGKYYFPNVRFRCAYCKECHN